jgi:hypothetical protein
VTNATTGTTAMVRNRRVTTCVHLISCNQDTSNFLGIFRCNTQETRKS